jgi:hypothetical protein
VQILSEVNRPYIIDSFTAPLGVSHFWTLSGHMMDFKLEEMQYLEEIVGQTIRIRVQNLDIDLPASWSILIVDKETYTIDMVPIAQLASFDQDVLLFSPDDSKLKTGKAMVIDYREKAVCIAPEIPKGSAMIHPTGPELSHGRSIFYGIVVGGHDLYRYIGGKTVGDILG